MRQDRRTEQAKRSLLVPFGILAAMNNNHNTTTHNNTWPGQKATGLDMATCCLA